jgi:hypothetical protein
MTILKQEAKVHLPQPFTSPYPHCVCGKAHITGGNHARLRVWVFGGQWSESTTRNAVISFTKQCYPELTGLECGPDGDCWIVEFQFNEHYTYKNYEFRMSRYE